MATDDTPDASPKSFLPVPIRAQPDDTTCGPTCLQAVYRYYGDRLPLRQVIEETGKLALGGTLAVFLACHALKRGYRAVLYSYNLRVFDPSWFQGRDVDLADRLALQAERKSDEKLRVATDAYLEYIRLGGEVRLEVLTPGLIRRYLKRSVPLMVGLSATYLYQSPREDPETDDFDDVGGEPSGHFAILCGYDQKTRKLGIADPLQSNPMAEGLHYWVDMNRLLGAIYLGVLTYDGNLLVLEPGTTRRS